MKTVILGTSGSGKSTLANALGKQEGVEVLHLDAVHFLPGWVERDQADEEARVEAFLDHHAAWVMDGNYSNLCYERRLDEADRIIVLYFNRFACLGRVVRRWWQNRGRVRDSAAPGCKEKLDAEFLWWVLYKGRRPAFRARLDAIEKRYPEKCIRITNQKQLDAYKRCCRKDG